MIIDMRNDEHLDVFFDARDDRREVIVDKHEGDIRICDGSHIAKITFSPDSKKMDAVLVDDLYVWTGRR